MTGRMLVALDLDGTVVLEDESFSPGVEAAVRRTVEAGHIVTIATGRSWEATSYILHRLAILPEYVVCSNGAAILSRDPNQQTGYARHTTETFDATAVLTLLREQLPDANYLAELADGTRLYTQYVDDWGLERETARQVELEEMMGIEVARIVVVSPEHSEGDFLELVDQIGLQQVSYAVGWTAWLDIAPKGVDKGTALEQVRQWQGIDPADVVVIGDGRNDIGMFQWAASHGGRAFAMGQAPPEVVEVSTDITGTVQEGGVAEALDLLLARAATS
ncbi:HAD-IIB family hydrolase [Microbacterium album]|uniref:Haloacid dehalogenase n=1 Tax=Microbacterium album TaxID=2053191 RepID=A0A917IGV6_9MICO|nr:HAD-IIB family hydrolase [Microbacterium album]GGH45149.1 haloacid dehalogenase [Microbacterium album]